MKQPRLYSLFEKKDNCWVRLYETAMPLQQARRFWQDALLGMSMNGQYVELRPVPRPQPREDDICNDDWIARNYDGC
jgi:hypothetical protein